MSNFAAQDIAKEADVVDLDHGDHGEHGHGHGDDHDHANCTDGEHKHGHGHGHGSEHEHKSKPQSRHDARVTSFSIVKEGEVDPTKFNWWLQYVHKLPPQYGTLFRMKGILAMKGVPNKHIFHAVMDAFAQDEAGPWVEGEKKVNKYVFIGKSLDKQHL